MKMLWKVSEKRGRVPFLAVGNEAGPDLENLEFLSLINGCYDECIRIGAEYLGRFLEPPRKKTYKPVQLMAGLYCDGRMLPVAGVVDYTDGKAVYRVYIMVKGANGLARCFGDFGGAFRFCQYEMLLPDATPKGAPVFPRPYPLACLLEKNMLCVGQEDYVQNDTPGSFQLFSEQLKILQADFQVTMKAAEACLQKYLGTNDSFELGWMNCQQYLGIDFTPYDGYSIVCHREDATYASEYVYCLYQARFSLQGIPTGYAFALW